MTEYPDAGQTESSFSERLKACCYSINAVGLLYQASPAIFSKGQLPAHGGPFRNG